MSGRLDATATSGPEKDHLAGTGEHLEERAVAGIHKDAHGKGASAAVEMKPNSSAAYLSDFQIVGSDDKRSAAPVHGSKHLSAKLEAAVDAINETTNGGLTGIGTDVADLWRAIAPLNAQEFALVNDRFAQKYGKAYASHGAKWDIASELKDELGTDDLGRFNHMIADKSVNLVPAEFRATGESLLKPASGLKVGEMTRVKLSDGRDYDVYIPRNADKRAPVIVAMGGAGLGDMKGVMATETGLAIEAEKEGSIVVFANPKPRVLDGSYGKESSTWNTPGRTNMPAQVDNSYDDRKYLDNVISDLSKRTQMAEKVGMMGFSDGARLAEVYAADRPQRVAGVVSMSGTWMDGDALPHQAIPTMIIHGDADEILPYKGGFGDTSEEILVPTNLAHSKPSMQGQVWSGAAGGNGRIIERHVEGNVEKRVYDARNTPVVEYIVKGADHGVHDYKNNGDRWWQYALGQPDLHQDFVTRGAGFLKDNIMRTLGS